MNTPDYFSERNSKQFLGLKYLNSLMLIRIRNIFDPESGIRDVGSGMEKFGSGIRDKHPGSATLEK
jgi:hypothetical protein